jgi:hypothetical protein
MVDAIPRERAAQVQDDKQDECDPAERPPERLRSVPCTGEIMSGGGRRDEATPGEGILTSTENDRDAATD